MFVYGGDAWKRFRDKEGDGDNDTVIILNYRWLIVLI